MPTYPDFGMHLKNKGWKKDAIWTFAPFPVLNITRVSEKVFSTMSNLVADEGEFAVSLDFVRIFSTRSLLFYLRITHSKRRNSSAVNIVGRRLFVLIGRFGLRSIRCLVSRFKTTTKNTFP